MAPGRRRIIREDAGNTRYSRLEAVHIKKPLREIFFQNHVVIKEQPYISAGGVHPSIPRDRGSHDDA